MFMFNRIFINKTLYLFFTESYNSTYKLIDRQILEILGPFGLIFNLKKILISINSLTTGLIYHYSGIMLLFSIFFIFITLNFEYVYIFF